MIVWRPTRPKVDAIGPDLLSHCLRCALFEPLYLNCRSC
jgi:hypothetical protein